MKQRLTVRTLALAVALGTTLLLVAAAQAATTSQSRNRNTTGTLVGLRKTALGTILVDARGRTLYLFEKDRTGVSMCTSACAKYWPPLTSHGTPRAGKGVKQSLLRLVRARDGARQVSYAGHPLYTFVADKRAGQTAGEGLDNFGAEWYAVATNGHKVEQDESVSGNSGSSSGSGSGGGYGNSGDGW
jgi:predicted lipoprotein with Yx(FWY)xxD motif